jgi:hypothetical protein
MDLSLLDTLKEKLTTGKDFGEVWEYFLDNFGEKPEFLELGRRKHDPILQQILSQMTIQLFGKEAPLREIMFLEVAEKSFIHGGCILGNKMSNLIYFEDVQVGLLAIVWSFTPSETKLIRFSPRPPVRMATPSLN